MKLTDLMYSNDYISDLSAPSLFPTGTNKSILSGFLFYFFFFIIIILLESHCECIKI